MPLRRIGIHACAEHAWRRSQAAGSPAIRNASQNLGVASSMRTAA